MQLQSYIKKTLMNPLVIQGTKFCGLVLATATVHWALVQFYAYYCAPWSWAGPFTTLLSLGSPVCHFINYVQFELAKHYITIWTLAGGSLVAYLFASKKG